MRFRRRRCPECGSKDTLKITYGLPTDEAMKEAMEGRAALGGCVIEQGAPLRRCMVCGHEFGRLSRRGERSSGPERL